MDLITQVVNKRIVAAHGVEVSLARKGHVGMGVRNHGIRDIHGQATLHRTLDHGTPSLMTRAWFSYIGEFIGHRGKTGSAGSHIDGHSPA